MQTSLDEAFHEAVVALGEAIVRERFLQARINRLEAQLRQANNTADNEGAPR